MTAPTLSDLRAAYEVWLGKPTRTQHVRVPALEGAGPRELDIFAFDEEEDQDAPFTYVATSGMSPFEIAPSRRIELVLPISARIDDAQFGVLAQRLGELAAMAFRDRRGVAPNVVIGPCSLPPFEGKRFALLADFNVRGAEYLQIQPEVRLLRVTPLTDAEAKVARDIGDIDIYHRFQLEGVLHEDPDRTEAALSDPVPAATDPGSPSSITDLWTAIDGWLGAHAAPTLRALRPCAEDAALADLERTIGVALPADYRASLQRHDGGANLTDYEYLSVARVASVWTLKQKALNDGAFVGRDVETKGGGVVRNFWWHPGWIPFAEDSVGNLLCIDTVPGFRGVRGQIIHWERASGPFPGRHPSFHAWLGAYRDELLAGQTYEVDADGLIHVKV